MSTGSRPRQSSRPSRPRDVVAFGYAGRAQSEGSREKLGSFTTLLGKLAGVDVSPAPADSYELLARRLYKRRVDLAWMPPLGWIALEQKKRAVPLVTHVRGGSHEFHAVIVVHKESRIRTPLGLRNKRAAWVDAHSASGFVLPRIQLAALGVDPRTAFAEERFHGSHEAVVRAVVEGRADFGATYARLDRSGEAVHGAWSEVPGAEGALRVLVAFGRVPADVIVARPDLPEATREALTRALLGVCSDARGALLVRDVFGVTEFRRWTPASYEALRAIAAEAHAGGLLDAKRIAHEAT